jgi:ABC-type glycerol-3-phosphate transport system substrate-binding protein
MFRMSRSKFPIVLLLIAGFLLGCSGLSLAKSNVTLTFWWFHAAEVAKIVEREALKSFTPQTGIRVKFVPFGYSSSLNKILLAAASGQVPDLVYSLPDWSMELYTRGAVVDLKRAYGDKWPSMEERFFPGALHGLNYRGAQFGLPDNLWSQVVIYREDFFNQYGWEVPTTWDDLYALLPKLRAQNKMFIYPYEISTHIEWGLPTAFAPFLYQAGGDFWNEERTKSGFDSPEGKQAFKEFTELYTKWGVPLEVNINKVWKDGEAAISAHSVCSIDQYRILAPDVTKVAPAFGHIRDGKLDKSTNLFAWTVYVMEGSKHQKEALQFLDWYFTLEPNLAIWEGWRKLAPGRLYTSGMKDTANAFFDRYYPEDKDIVFDQANASKMVSPALGIYGMTRFLLNAFNEVTLKKDDPVKAIENAAYEINKEMDRKHEEFERFGVGK